MGNCCDGEAKSPELRRFHSPAMANYRGLLRAIHRTLDEPPEPYEGVVTLVQRGSSSSAVDPATAPALHAAIAAARPRQRVRMPLSCIKGTREAVLQLGFSTASEATEPFSVVAPQASSGSQLQRMDTSSFATSANAYRVTTTTMAAASPAARHDGNEDAPMERLREVSMATPQGTPPPTPQPASSSQRCQHLEVPSPSSSVCTAPGNSIQTVGAAVDKPGGTPLFPQMRDTGSSLDTSPQSNWQQTPQPTPQATPPTGGQPSSLPDGHDAHMPPPPLTLQNSSATQHLVSTASLSMGPASAVVRRVRFPPEIEAVPFSEVKHIPLAKLWKQRRMAQMSTSPTLPKTTSAPTPKSSSDAPASGAAETKAPGGASGGKLRPAPIVRPRTPPSRQLTPQNNSFENTTAAGLTPHVMLTSGFTPY